MNLLEEAWEAEDNARKENYKKNMECFKALYDKAKFDLMWEEYVNKHCDDVGLHNILKKKLTNK